MLARHVRVPAGSRPRCGAGDGRGGDGAAGADGAAPLWVAPLRCARTHTRARAHTHKHTHTHTAVDWAILSNDDAPAEQVGAAAARIGAELARRAAAAVGSANTAGSAS